MSSAHAQRVPLPFEIAGTRFAVGARHLMKAPGRAIVACLVLFACVPARPASDAGTASDRDEVDVAKTAREEPAAFSDAPAFPDERAPAQSPAAGGSAATLVSGPRLDRARLVRAVLARNPDIDARRAAWRAARARKGQAGALEDPMLGYEVAPLSLFSGMRVGQTITLSQRFPWPGKLSNAEKAEEEAAEASGQEVKLGELDMALEASLLFDELWFVDRSVEVNAEHGRLLDEMKKGAEVQYSVGRAALSDPLQAEVELAMLSERNLGLDSERDTVVAELNALLHREPTRPLPPPPRDLPGVLVLPPPSRELMAQALSQSPELKKLAARARSAGARIRFAERQYYPDLTLMASYSSMWEDPEHRFMVGIETPIPLQRGSRGGAVEEASAMLAEIKSEARRAVDLVRTRVETERRRVIEGIQVVKLYDARLIPAARSQVAAARNDFAAGSADFASVISAEKNLRNIQLSRHMAIAELSKRRARLDRSLGRLPHGIQK